MEEKQGFEWNGRQYRDRDTAAQFFRLYREINRGRERMVQQYGRIDTSFCDPPAVSDGLPPKLLTGSQAEALKTVQKLARQIVSAVEVINHQNAAYELDLPPLLLGELAVYLMQADERIRAAKTAAKTLGVKPVTEQLKTVLENRATERLNAA